MGCALSDSEALPTFSDTFVSVNKCGIDGKLIYHLIFLLGRSQQTTNVLFYL